MTISIIGSQVCLVNEVNPINNQPINLVIFDCDGVLVDSEIISANILIEYLHSLSVHIDFEYVQRNFLGRSFSYVVENINEKFNVLLPDNIEEIYMLKLLDAFKNELQPIEGITDVLSHLSVDYCLASSSSPERVKVSLKNTSLTCWFPDKIFTAYQVEYGKPAPDLFLHAAKKMGYAPQNCLVIEDSRSGIQAAMSAGMQVMHFFGGSHLKHQKTQILAGAELNIPVINEWSEFFDQRPDLKRK